VFYRVVSRTSTRGALVTVNQLLNRLTVPLLLLWGDKVSYTVCSTCLDLMN
jgi:hypothetical protein